VQAYYFKTVSEAAQKAPKLKSAVTSGELSLSKARRIAPVIKTENQTQWIEDAKTMKQPELERKVAVENPRARTGSQEKLKPIAKDTSKLEITIDDKTRRNLEALKELLSQASHPIGCCRLGK
jgi:hypothetical protein